MFVILVEGKRGLIPLSGGTLLLRFLSSTKMIKVKIITTGVVREVTPNVAHDLIDSGKAILAKQPQRVINTQVSPYRDRQISAKPRSRRRHRARGR